MPDRRPVHDRIFRQGHRLREPQRLYQPPPQRGVPLPAVEDLDDPAGQHEPAVAVRVGLAHRADLNRSGQLADVAFQAVGTPPGVGEDVAVDPAGVREQVPDRDLPADVLGTEANSPQHLGDRGLQPEPPSSTSCMIIVAVHTLVIEPTWNSASGVTSTRVAVDSTP